MTISAKATNTQRERIDQRSAADWRGTFAVRVLALLGMAVAIAAGTASAARAQQPLVAGETSYAIGVPACAPVKGPGKARCFAMTRVVVDRKTPGALPFRPAAGAMAAGTMGPAGGLTPGDLASAYALPTATGGVGQTVAIVDAYNDPNIESDLQAFDSEYGLRTCTEANLCLKVVGQTGSTTALPSNDTTGWSIEETLDVETVHAICQQCKIILIEANSSSDADLAAAVNEAVALKATVISNSYGGPESGETSTSEAAYNHPGIVIVASTGDDGYYSFDRLDSTNQPDFPASSPYVVAVGGTSLYLTETATREYEYVWNDNGVKDYFEEVSGYILGAGGGGCSTVFTAPGWQTHVAGWSSTGCGTKRLSADVAAVADYLTGFDIYYTYSCGGQCSQYGWSTEGGTSLAAPVIAGVYALAGGAKGIRYPALTLYGQLGKAYDVTIGGNGWCDGEVAAQCGDPNTSSDGVVDCDYTAAGKAEANRACAALAGYDGPTGVGTPKGLAAFTKTGPTATIAAPGSVVHGTSATWTATATDPFPGGAATQYTWSWGDGTAATVTTTASAGHTYAKSGDYTISITVMDNYAVTGAAATDAVTVQ